MMNPELTLQLGRERHRDLLNNASLRRRHTLPAEAPPAGTDHLVLSGRAAHVIDARVRAETRPDCRDVA